MCSPCPAPVQSSDDVKIFGFYGEIAFVMLRRVADHTKIGSLSFRFLDADGTDLGQSFTREYDRILGRMYDEAEGRLHLDLARGGSYAVTFGPHDRP